MYVPAFLKLLKSAICVTVEEFLDCRCAPNFPLYKIAEEYELSGGTIINLLRHCAMAAINRKDTVVTRQELMAGLRKEFKKENKTFHFSN